MKITIKNIIKEDNNKVDRYINKITQILQKPYIYNLKTMDVPEEYWNDILSKIFNEPFKLNKYGNVTLIIDERDNILYEEYGIYWQSQLFDHKNNLLFYEESKGLWEKNEYDYYEDGGYRKHSEGSDGYWSISEWDKDGKEVYFSDSNGELIDERPTNNINESVEDKKETFINKVVDMLMSITEFIPIKNEKGFTTQVEVIWPMYGNFEIMDKNDIDYYINYLSVWNLSEVEIKYMYDMFGIEDQRLIQIIFDKYGQKSHTIINNMLNS